MVFEAKKPVWDFNTKSFRLNFGGKAKISSVKNIQIVHKKHSENIYLQLAKQNKTDYLLDFYGPFSPMQAFAIAIANIDHT